LRGELVNQTIRQRIAEGHTEFEHVHSQLIECERQLPRGLEVRISRPDVHDETLLLFALKQGKSLLDTVHSPEKVAKWTCSEQREIG